MGASSSGKDFGLAYSGDSLYFAHLFLNLADKTNFAYLVTVISAKIRGQTWHLAPLDKS